MKKLFTLILIILVFKFSYSQDNLELFNEHKSELNIPLLHSTYNEYDFYLNKAENTHTSFKPYIYSEVSNYLDLTNTKESLFKNKSSWFGRKFWNEHFVNIQGENFWFTVNPIFDLQIGKDNSDAFDYTYNNTRAIQIQGGLGKGLSFHTSFYESQGRFANYINETATVNPPLGAGATVPGRGKGKGFKEGGFDYPIAEAYLSYSPNEIFNFQFGNSKNFIGDGYRSFMLSDVASPYPSFKINTKFWKIKYTNIWMWMDDVRRDVVEDDINLRKYVAIHHLSWNVTKKLNLGFFEAVISKKTPNSGFDINFFNPLIFYRAAEFTRGSENGNAIIGLDGKYKVNDKVSLYSQFVLDELTVGRFFDGSGYWANKYAIQFGAKYYNAFGIDNLYLQSEFNIAKPFIFSHYNKSVLNYGHFNQPIGHLWGSNFWEGVGIVQYRKDRWFANAKIVLGKKGFDFENEPNISYGGNIYVDYDLRNNNEGIKLLQGNTTDIFIGDLQAGYIVNPSTNTKLFAGFTFRNFTPASESRSFTKDNTTWFTFGLKADLFNWYFDF